MIGAHYSYAEVPIGYWMKGAFGFALNHFDRIGHFPQGFVPAMVWAFVGAVVAQLTLSRAHDRRSARWPT